MRSTTIVAKDPQTLVFTLDYPAPLDLIASANYAAYIYDTQAAGAPATGTGASDAALVAWFKTGKDAGTGPYTIASWKPGDEFELTLNKYDGYWGGWQGSHYAKVVFRVVPEVTTAAQLAQSGDVSYVDRLTPQLITSLKSDPDLQVVETPSFQNLVALLNTASGPLKDPNVRKAVAKAFDVNGIVSALGGSVVAAKGVIPPGLIGYSDSLTGTGLDLAGAASLLAASGYGPNGKSLTITATIVSGDTDLQLVTTSLKSNLAKLNITLDVQALQWQAQWDEAKSSDIAKRQDVFLMYWWPDYADPFSWFISLFHSESTPNFNLAYYSNKKFDAEIDGIQALEATNRDAADAEYVTMQQQLIDDAVVVVPYVQNYQRVLQASVGRVRRQPGLRPGRLRLRPDARPVRAARNRAAGRPPARRPAPASRPSRDHAPDPGPPRPAVSRRRARRRVARVRHHPPPARRRGGDLGRATGDRGRAGAGACAARPRQAAVGPGRPLHRRPRHGQLGNVDPHPPAGPERRLGSLHDLARARHVRARHRGAHRDPARSAGSPLERTPARLDRGNRVIPAGFGPDLLAGACCSSS